MQDVGGVDKMKSATKLYTGFVLALLCAIGSPLHAEECRKSGTICVEGEATKTINGAQIHKACWRFQDTYDCVEENVIDNCAPLKTAAGCVQTNSVCKERAFNGDCLIYTNTYSCVDEQPPNPGIKLLDSSYTITKDELGEQCKSLAENPNCSKTGSVCTEPGGTRNINGLDVTKDCWAYEDTYACVNIVDDCKELQSNPACTVISQTCDSPNEDGTCALKSTKYRCATGETPPSETTTCGGMMCANGLCFPVPNGNDKDFAASITQMEAGREGAGYALDPESLKFFSGKQNSCHKNSLANCCKSNADGADKSNGAIVSNVMGVAKQAWGSWYVYDMLDPIATVQNTNAIGALYSTFASSGSAATFNPSNIGISYYGVSFNPFVAGGVTEMFAFDPWSFAAAVAIAVITDLMTCEQNEKILAMQRGQNLCTEIGSFCTQKFLGSCVSRKTSFCCFNSRLAKLINDQGRPLIGKKWGTPQSPDCSGFSEDEFKGLDFSKLDLSEFADEVMKNAKMPDVTGTTTGAKATINNKIQSYFSD